MTIARDTWPVLPVFKLMQELGHVTDAEMFRTFNMGVGMVIISSAQDAGTITSHLAERGESVYEIGRVVEGNREVMIG